VYAQGVLARAAVAAIAALLGAVLASAGPGGSPSYPADGSLVRVGHVERDGSTLRLTDVSVLGGRLRVAGIAVGANEEVAGATLDGAALAAAPNEVVPLPPSGWAVLLQRAVVAADAGGTRRADVAIRLHLTIATAGVPAGSDLLIGYAAGAVGAGEAGGAAREIPPALLPTYQAAGARYGVPWSVLAAINRVESSFGADLRTSPAGAVGWMQFMPATWASYGVDADADGRADPYDPVDAIFSAANLLAQDGAGRDMAGAVWLYNHSDHYVQTVLALAHAYETGGAEPAGIDLAASPAAHAGGPFSPALLW
jgi:soluble lytic murein transglycosylase-like protein